MCRVGVPSRDGCHFLDAEVRLRICPHHRAGGTEQIEEPIFVRMRIAHYGAMLKLNLGDENRATIRRLLAEAEKNLVAVTALKEQY